MEYLYLIYPLLYFIVLVVGFLNFEKIKEATYLKLFLFFLGYSLLTELIAFYIGICLKINTFYIYNTWNFINTYFFLFFFLKNIQGGFKRNIVKILILIYTIFSVIDVLFFTNFITKSLNTNIMVASLFIVSTVLIYFSELLQSNIILNLKDSIYFWIAIGVLFFNIGFIPIIIIAEYINYLGVFKYITFGLNILMSVCFILGFILSKKEYNN